MTGVQTCALPISQALTKKWILLLAFLLLSPLSQADDSEALDQIQIKILIARPDGKMDENAAVPTQPSADFARLMMSEGSYSQNANGTGQFPYALYSKLSPAQKSIIQRHLLARINESQIPSLKNLEDGKIFLKHQVTAMAHRMMFFLLPLTQGESLRICAESESKMPDHIKKELGVLEKISNEILVALRSIIQPTDLSVEPSLNYRIQLVTKSAQPIPHSCLQFEKADLSTADISKAGQKPQKKRPVTPARKSSN